MSKDGGLHNKRSPFKGVKKTHIFTLKYPLSTILLTVTKCYTSKLKYLNDKS